MSLQSYPHSVRDVVEDPDWVVAEFAVGELVDGNLTLEEIDCTGSVLTLVRSMLLAFHFSGLGLKKIPEVS